MNNATLQRNLALLIFCCLLIVGLSAQSTSRPWHVYLKDGNFLRAEVLDTLPNGQLSVRSTTNAEPILLPWILIEEIKRAPRGSLLGRNGRTVQAEGWYLEGSAMLLTAETATAGSVNDWRSSLSFQFGAGYYYRPWLAIGAGLTIDWYDEAIVPVFLQARAYLPHRTTSPYLQLQAGYGFAAHEVFQSNEFERTHGGLFWHPAIGLRLATKRRVDYHLDLGYRFQHLRYEFEGPPNNWWWPLSETRRVDYRSFVIRLTGVF